MSNSRALRRVAELLGPLPVLLCLVGAILLMTPLGSAGLQRNINAALIQLIIVVGLYIFIGNSGVFSFGHMCFMALGAYTAALLTIPVRNKALILPGLPDFLASAQTSPITATLIGAGIAALFASVIAIPLMRVSGLTAGLATVALLIIVRVVLGNWGEVTAGTAGLAGIPTSTNRFTIAAWVLVSLLVAQAYQVTSAGLRLRSSREDDIAASAVGIRVSAERRVAFVISAAVVGAGGALYAQFQGNITPDAFYLKQTFLVIAMLVIGGMTSLSGAVLGALAVSAAAQLFRTAESGFTIGSMTITARPGLTEVGLALLMLLVLILRPSGITGGREIGFRFRRRFKTDSRANKKIQSETNAAISPRADSNDAPPPADPR